MNHTPGPWDWYVGGPKEGLWVGAGGEVVCIEVSSAANARLIAAAPELLDALKTLCAPTIVRPVGFGERYERAEAAIAAAGD
jgi:hypothetical protein